MAVLAIGLIGSFAGYAIGGTMLAAQIGFMVGTMIGNAMFPPPAQEGPRLTDLKMTTSAYGQAVPFIIGTMRVAANCIWSQDKEEHKHSSGGGKGGGGGSNTYTYTLNAAFLLAQGPNVKVRKIWANSILVYDASGQSASGIINSSKLGASIVIYSGDDDQQPDSLMQSVNGVSYTPAYRGTAYVVLKGWDLTPYGGQVANLEFEIVCAGTSVGSRMLSNGAYNFSALTSSQYNVPAQGLYHTYSAGYPTGGESCGAVVIMGVNNDILDIVGDGPLTSSTMEPGNVPPAYNDNRWQIDQNGNILAQGSRAVDYQGQYSAFGQFDTAAGDPHELHQSFLCQWIGKAGLVNLFLNRVAPLEIGGTTVGDGGYYKCSYDPIVMSYEHLTTDPGEFMNCLRANATGFINGVFPSADGLLCLVLTGPTKGVSDTWHRLSFAAITTQYEGSGSLAPGVNPTGWGRQGGNFGGSGMLEEDGVHLWNMTASGELYCFEIALEDEVMRQIYHEPNPPHRSGFSGTQGFPCVYATHSVCYLANNTYFSTFTRTEAVTDDPVPLSDAVSLICGRAGLAAGDIDVSQLADDVVHGVAYTSSTYRAMIESLRTVYAFDCDERDDKLYFIKRGMEPVLDIPEDDLAARDGMSFDSPPDQLRITRQQEMELPFRVGLDYYARDADWQDGSQTAINQSTTSQNAIKIQCPIALDSNEAQACAEMNLWQLWANRTTFEFATNRKYANLCPTDVVTINKNGQKYTVRIVKRTDGANGVMSWAAVSENSSVYKQVGMGGVVLPGTQSVSFPGPTELVPIDAPALKDSYGNAPTIFLAANGYDTTWKGASLLQSFDEGQSYVDTGISFESPTAIGKTSSALAAPQSRGIFDESSSFTVFMSNPTSALQSDTAVNVMRGMNCAYVGGEIIGFKRAVMIAPRQYQLSGLLRGLKGTEDFMSSHAAGEDFVLLNTTTMRAEQIDTSMIGTILNLKPVTYGTSATNARARKTPFGARNVRPLSPVRINATKSAATASADWKFSWDRRARTGGDWRDGVDAAIGVDGQHYEVDVMLCPHPWPDMSGATVVRTIAGLTTPACNYTLAQQTADFGGGTSYVTLRVFQTNDLVGRSPLVDNYHFVFNPPTLDGGPAIVTGSGFPWDIFLKLQGANGSTTVVDSGAHPLSWTMHGGAALSTASPKLGVSSLELDGTSGYVDAPYAPGSPVDLSAAQFTVNWSQYRTSGIGIQVIAGRWDTTGNYSWLIYVDASTLNIAYQPLSGGAVSLTYPFAYAANVWDEIELACDANMLRAFANGREIGTAQSLPAFFAGTSNLTLGRNADFVGTGGAQQYFAGKIFGFRISNSRCRDTANFKPASDALLHFGGATGSVSVIDSSLNASAWLINGPNVKIDAGSSPFSGGGSLDCPVGAAGDFAYSTDPVMIQNMSAGRPFCFGVWFKTVQTRAYAGLITKYSSGFNSGDFAVYAADGTGNGRPEIYAADYTAGPLLTSATAGYNDGAWHLLLWSFDGATHRMIIDNVVKATNTATFAFGASAGGIYVGNDPNGSTRGFVGKLAEFTANFSAAGYPGYGLPTAPFQE